MKRTRWLILIVVLLLAACGAPIPTPTPAPTPTPTPGCASDAVTAYLDDLNVLTSEWDDAVAVAGNTGRGMLSPVVQDMQRIRRGVNELETPCAEADAVRDVVAEWMGHIIDGYLSFMAQESDGTVEQHFGKARTISGRMGDAYTALEVWQ